MRKYLKLQYGNAGMIHNLSLWLSRFHAAVSPLEYLLAYLCHQLEKRSPFSRENVDVFGELQQSSKSVERLAWRHLRCFQRMKLKRGKT